MENARVRPESGPSLLGHFLWALLWSGLFAWQGWMTLSLFGEERPCEAMLDARPVVSGRHPLHLYHGYLGAHSFKYRGEACCYNPAFQAGYPKSPLFDSGSKPAEFFLYCAGGEYRPEAYKIGLVCCCLLFPLGLAIAASAAGLGRASTFLSVTLSLLVFWGAPGHVALEDGQLDLILATLAAVVHTGMLVSFHRAPGVFCWATLLLSGVVGWFVQPLLFLLTIPVWLSYYLSVGAKHPYLAWHLALYAATAGAFGVNLVWLSDWVTFWWVRAPLAHVPILAHRTIATFWQADLWGEPADRTLEAVVLLSAAAGLAMLNRGPSRTTARLLGLAMGILLLLSFAGLGVEKAARWGTCRLFLPALIFAVVPAGHAWMTVLRGSCRLLGHRAGLVLAFGIIVGMLLAGRETVMDLARRSVGTAPLSLGLSPEQQKLLETLQGESGREARILWEDGTEARQSRWTALLPLLTDRAFLGGLDPQAGIEHVYPSLIDQTLAGRHILTWTDAELDDFCRKYNVGWIVCRSGANLDRFRAWKGAAATTVLSGSQERVLFTVQRRPHSYTLKGEAQLVLADSRHITLAEVIPDGGEVVLSFHYQSGMRATPGSVSVEREPDAQDPVAFIRLRLDRPVACVTLTWDGH
jgi:hypothetical protein